MSVSRTCVAYPVTELQSGKSGFPTQLLPFHDCPTALWVKGDASLLQAPSLCIVGTRQMTSYGEEVVRLLVPQLVRSGFVIVSGLAVGADACVHRTVLRAGGKTIAVIPGGIDRLTPSVHERLALDILDNGGAVCAEYKQFSGLQKYLFIRRNRILAGLSLATIVIEAAEQSGSLITAHWAAEYGRTVFAVPGPITSKFSDGTRALINMGAVLVASVQDILQEESLRAVPVEGKSVTRSSLFSPTSLLTTAQQHVWQVVQEKQSVTMIELAHVLHQTVADISLLITQLELQGWIHVKQGVITPSVV